MVAGHNDLTRRGFLGASALGALGLGAALSGCSGGQLSSDPHELVLWYWARSVSPRFLKQAAAQIPGSTDFRVRADVGGTANWDTKVRTALSGRAYIPDILFINSNVSLYFPDEQLFVDLNDYSSAEQKSQYYDWKWNLGTTRSGRHCFWPLDTGPTAFFYHADVLAKAGLPTDPAEVSEAVSTWDKFIDVGKRVRSKAGAAMLITSSTVFSQFINASPQRYFNRDDEPIYADRDSAVRQAWDVAVEAIRAKVTGNLQTASDQNAGWVSGRVAGHIEGAWWSQILHDTAPALSGKWRIAQQPVRPGNSGGSFVCIPKTSKDPQAAFDFLSWLNAPDNQATTFNDVQLIPSAPGAFSSGIMREPNKYFGSQNPLQVFAALASRIAVSYISPYEAQIAPFAAELVNVESGGKNPDRAWNDAVAQTDRQLKKLGVGV